MPISWNEIRQNAIAFSRDWKGVEREEAEAKSFWDEFFAVFGIKRRTVASFEEPVRKLSGSWGFIDLFWPGTLLVEHKSKGKSLDKAESQALAYIRGLKDEGRDEEIPRYVVVSDFARIALHDLEDSTSVVFPLADLYQHIDKFAFIPGYKQHKRAAEDPINIRAVEIMGDLHDALADGGYTGHDLERFLVRVLFCLFADDTGIFERNAFGLYVENHTAGDGSDLGPQLARIFQVLDTPPEKRQRNLASELADLPYVNGDLFSERLGFADFNRAMRDQLIRCTRFDWSRISPAVFGSLFQSVMEPRERRQVGAHYTSERDILKLVRSLFLDDLQAEFEKGKGNKNRLKEFQKKLAGLTFLDPACGCGNFLVVTYRELRLLELEVVKAIHGESRVFDVSILSHVDVDAMYGIEINEFPVRIAEVALWLVDHQMNQRLSEAFGQYYVHLPLRKSAKIVHANALRIDWKTVLPAERCTYVLGNPPFVGSKFQTTEQRHDIELVASSVKNRRAIDYVGGWYLKAADYIAGTKIAVAFVSTNSITQGEQVAALWKTLHHKGVAINFAHRTFAWESEARGKAHVHVVIVGFGIVEAAERFIFVYENIKSMPNRVKVRSINAYLIDAKDVFVEGRLSPLCQSPPMINGSIPADGGNLILERHEKESLLAVEPKALKWLKKYVGAEGYINNHFRDCLWLVECPPNELRSMPEVMKRVSAVREMRLASEKAATRQKATFPTLFTENRQPTSGNYLAVPRTSSENRKYIPIGYLDFDVIAANDLQLIPSASVYQFGIIASTFHMSWVRMTAGRLKSDLRYSAKFCYNTFPWPEKPSDKQKTAVAASAQAVLDARAANPDSSMADLYDPLTMPAKLAQAHAALDRAVELCYRPKPFANDRERVEFLFELYEKLTAPLTADLEPKSGRRKKATDDDSAA